MYWYCLKIRSSNVQYTRWSSLYQKVKDISFQFIRMYILSINRCNVLSTTNHQNAFQCMYKFSIWKPFVRFYVIKINNVMSLILISIYRLPITKYIIKRLFVAWYEKYIATCFLEIDLYCAFLNLKPSSEEQSNNQCKDTQLTASKADIYCNSCYHHCQQQMLLPCIIFVLAYNSIGKYFIFHMFCMKLATEQSWISGLLGWNTM
jgi:hypothetical protein